MKLKRPRVCDDCKQACIALIVTTYGAAYCRRCMFNARR